MKLFYFQQSQIQLSLSRLRNEERILTTKVVNLEEQIKDLHAVHELKWNNLTKQLEASREEFNRKLDEKKTECTILYNFKINYSIINFIFFNMTITHYYYRWKHYTSNGFQVY